MGNGNGNGSSTPVGRTTFTLGQVLQFLGLVASGLMMYANLKGDIREGFAQVAGRLDDHDHRIEAIEKHQDREDRHRSR